MRERREQTPVYAIEIDSRDVAEGPSPLTAAGAGLRRGVGMDAMVAFATFPVVHGPIP
ncbi:MAG TPA: hypothetical protein VLH79_01285 [Chthonomonadales bacterium]|nr:hypothetical protein [Chthonomonadales bacterium]